MNVKRQHGVARLLYVGAGASLTLFAAAASRVHAEPYYARDANDMVPYSVNPKVPQLLYSAVDGDTVGLFEAGAPNGFLTLSANSDGSSASGAANLLNCNSGAGDTLIQSGSTGDSSGAGGSAGSDRSVGGETSLSSGPEKYLIFNLPETPGGGIDSALTDSGLTVASNGPSVIESGVHVTAGGGSGVTANGHDVTAGESPGGRGIDLTLGGGVTSDESRGQGPADTNHTVLTSHARSTIKPSNGGVQGLETPLPSTALAGMALLAAMLVVGKWRAAQRPA